MMLPRFIFVINIFVKCKSSLIYPLPTYRSLKIRYKHPPSLNEYINITFIENSLVCFECFTLGKPISILNCITQLHPSKILNTTALYSFIIVMV